VSDIIGVFVFVPGWKEVVIRTPPAKRFQDFSRWGPSGLLPQRARVPPHGNVPPLEKEVVIRAPPAKSAGPSS